MIDLETIKRFKNKAIDYDETRRIIDYFSSIKKDRKPLYLDSNDFEMILRWKLAQQYKRQSELRKGNTDKIIRKVTSVALNISHEEEDYEIDLRLNLLMSLRGVGLPVASAILTLVYPDKYAVIDFRGWNQLFGEKKQSFTISDYKKYLREIRKLAGELGWTPQEVDLAIWEYDRVSEA